MAKLAGARSTEDEDLCRIIAQVSPCSEGARSPRLFILDTRPKVISCSFMKFEAIVVEVCAFLGKFLGRFFIIMPLERYDMTL